MPTLRINSATARPASACFNTAAPGAKKNLLKGLGAIDATLLRRGEIDAFGRHYVAQYPWLG